MVCTYLLLSVAIRMVQDFPFQKQDDTKNAKLCLQYLSPECWNILGLPRQVAMLHSFVMAVVDGCATTKSDSCKIRPSQSRRGNKLASHLHYLIVRPRPAEDETMTVSNAVLMPRYHNDDLGTYEGFPPEHQPLLLSIQLGSWLVLPKVIVLM